MWAPHAKTESQLDLLVFVSTNKISHSHEKFYYFSSQQASRSIISTAKNKLREEVRAENQN